MLRKMAKRNAAVTTRKLSETDEVFYEYINDNMKPVPGKFPNNYSIGRIHKEVTYGTPIDELYEFGDGSTFSVYRNENGKYEISGRPSERKWTRIEDHRIIMFDAKGLPWRTAEEFEKDCEWCGLHTNDMGFPDGVPNERTGNRWLVHYNQRSLKVDGVMFVKQKKASLYVGGVCTNNADSKKTYGLSISMFHLIKYMAEKTNRSLLTLQAIKTPMALYASLGFKSTGAIRNMNSRMEAADMTWYFKEDKPQKKWPNGGIEMILWNDDTILLGVNAQYELKLAWYKNGDDNVYSLKINNDDINLVNIGYGYRTLPQESVAYNDKYLALWLDDLLHIFELAPKQDIHRLEYYSLNPDTTSGNDFYNKSYASFIHMRWFGNVLHVLYGIKDLRTFDLDIVRNAGRNAGKPVVKRRRDDDDEQPRWEINWTNLNYEKQENLAMDKDTVVTATTQEISVWETDSGKMLYKALGRGDQQELEEIDTLDSYDGNIVAASYSGDDVYVFGNNVEKLQGHEGGVMGVAIHGDTIASIGISEYNPHMIVWKQDSDTKEFEEVFKMRLPEIAKGPIDIHKDIIVYADEGNVLRTVKRVNGEWEKSNELVPPYSDVIDIQSVAVHGDIIACSDISNKRVYIWEDGMLIHRINDGGHTIALDGTTLVVGSDNEKVNVWDVDVNSGYLLQTLDAHEGGTRRVAIKNDVIVTLGRRDKLIKSWKKNDPKRQRTKAEISNLVDTMMNLGLSN